MPRSGRPVITYRRRAWSLIRARKSGSLIAPTRLACPTCRPGRRPVARRAGPSEYASAAFLRSLSATPASLASSKLRRRSARGRLDSVPSCALDALGQDLDLLGRQMSAHGHGKGRHQGAGRPCRDDALQLRVRHRARNSLSFSGGAGPSLPSAPWQPAQFCWNRTLKRLFLLGRHIPVAGSGRPGKSQPGQPARRPATAIPGRPVASSAGS